jgi:hypothetical protein
MNPIEPTMLVGPVVGTVVRGAVDRIRGWLGRNQRALNEAWEAEKEALLFEFAARLEEVAAACGKLDERVSEAEAQRALLATQLEAVRSAGEDRVKMLGRALAGYFAPDVDLDLKRRLLRTVHQLEPSDVALLGRFELDVEEPQSTIEVAPGHTITAASPRSATRVIKNTLASYSDPELVSVNALVAAGCITVHGDRWTRNVDVTPLGKELLRFMRDRA